MHDMFESEIGEIMTEGRMAEALQEALALGSRTAALNLTDSSCTSDLIAVKGCSTGYLGNKLVEIAVPDTITRVFSKIDDFAKTMKPVFDNLHFGTEYKTPLQILLESDDYKESIKVALNRGAEQAAPASVAVFRDAIFGMSFDDAKDILMGSDTAATSYLRDRTYNGLRHTFKPLLEKPLNQLNPNKYWRGIAHEYNKLAEFYRKNDWGRYEYLGMPGLPYQSLPEDLVDYLANYATSWALDGLFTMVGKQEAKLKADPLGAINEVKELGNMLSDATGDLLNDVFGKAKKGAL